MPKKPKPKEDEPGPSGDWAEDQRDHEYYYDDAHGYEEYDPEKDEEETDEAKEGGDKDQSS